MKPPPSAIAVTPLFLWLLFTCQTGLAAEADAHKADQLFHEGFILYQKHHRYDGFKKFRQAAELGHAEAAYYAGEVIRKNHTFITPKAEKWYRKAADGGDVYAMLRLANADLCKLMTDCTISKDDWLERALNEALPKAKTGDVQAMKALYSTYGAKGDEDEAWEWLNKAASRGHVLSQYLLSYLIKNGYSFYWTDAGRMQDAIHWMRESAKGGFPKAMHELASLLEKQGKMKEARHWVREMGKTDYFTALITYGRSLVLGQDYKYKFPNDEKEKGLAVLYALIRETGSGQAKRIIAYAGDRLTPELKKSAKILSKKLLVDTPILYYDPKFGL